MAKTSTKSKRPILLDDISGKRAEDALFNCAHVINMIDVFFEAASIGKTFKVGDVLTVKVPEYNENDDDYVNKTLKDGYGLPTKYVVIAQSRRSGVSIVQKLNSEGKPYGKLRLLTSDEALFDSNIVEKMIETDGLNVLGYAGNSLDDEPKSEFLVDPDLEDAILTGSEYTPCEDKKKMKEIRREASKFNDSIRIPTIKSDAAIEKFIKTLKKGQIYWTSGKKFFLIDSISRNRDTVKISICGRGTELVDRTWFYYKRIYTDKPKSSK